jgi:tetratricopeptide (TPR) repeat protein
MAWDAVGRAYSELDDTVNALTSFQRALDLRPGYLGAALDLADAMAEAGSPGESADFLAGYLEISGYSHREDALVRLGRLREMAGDTAAAVAIYDSLGTASLESLKRLGLIHERRGDWGRAIKRYRMVLEVDSLDLWAHGELGLCFENVGREDLARQWYQEGIALDSSYAWAALRMGLLEYEAGAPEKAVEWLQMATEADPQMLQAWVNLGLALDEMGRFAESEPVYERVVELDPSDDWAWGQLGYAREALGDLEGAAAAYEAGIEHRPHNAWLWQQRGLLYEEEGRYDRAISWFREALQRSEPSPWILGELGSLLVRKGRPDSALIHYRASVELDSCYLFGQMNLARMLAGRGDYAEALRQMETYLACGGDSSIGLASTALLAGQAGLDSRADSLRRVIESRHPDAWVTLAWSYYYSYLEEQAAQLADTAMVRHTGGVEGWLSLADLYMQLDLLRSAGTCFSRAVEMRPDDPMPWLAWGAALYDRGRYDEAAARYHAAIEADSSSSDAWAYLGESLIFDGRLDQARESLQRAVDLDPQSVFAISYLGLVEERSGNPQKALDYYLQALRISPGYEYAESRIGVIADPSYDAGWWRMDSSPLTASIWLDLSVEQGNVEESEYRGGMEVGLKLDGRGSTVGLEGGGTLEEEESRETRNTAWARLTSSYFLTDGIYAEASSFWDRQPLTVRPWQVSSYAALGYKKWINEWAWLAPELGVGVVNSRWSWGEERTDELSSYASLGLWLQKEASLLPSLWIGVGVYSTPGQPDDLISDGNAELTFEAWRRLSVSLGWSYDYTKTPVIPIWDSMDTETYLRLNLDLF